MVLPEGLAPYAEAGVRDALPFLSVLSVDEVLVGVELHRLVAGVGRVKNFVHEGDNERGAIVQERAEHIVIGRVYDRRHPVPRPFGLPDSLQRLEAMPPPSS